LQSIRSCNSSILQLLKEKSSEELTVHSNLECNNTYAVNNTSIGKTALYSYAKKVKELIVQGEVKNTARTQAYENVRNPLSLCAVLNAAFETISPELFISVDEVSVLLNGWESKPQVLTSKKAKELLDELGMSVSITEETQKRRVVSFIAAICADGLALCTFMKIVDRNFTGFKDEPSIYKMDRGLYIYLAHTETSETKIFKDIYKLIAKEANEKKKFLFERDLYGLAGNRIQLTESTHESDNEMVGSSTLYNSSNPDYENITEIEQDVNRAFEEEDVQDQLIENVIDDRINVTAFDFIEHKYEYIAIACDGAFAQIDALLNHLNDKFISKGKKIMFVKYSGGCSMTQSPNDQGKMHIILHACVRSPSFRYENYSDPLGLNWLELKSLMKLYLDGSSFKTIWKCTCYAEDFLEKAFTTMNVKSAFRRAGVWPLNYARILSKCPHFRELNQEKADYVYNSVNQLSDVVKEHGYIPEDVFQDILSNEFEGLDNCVTKHGKPLNEQTASYDNE
jgi:hypothetical protein